MATSKSSNLNIQQFLTKEQVTWPSTTDLNVMVFTNYAEAAKIDNLQDNTEGKNPVLNTLPVL